MKTARFIKKSYYGFKVVRAAVKGKTTVKLGSRVVATPSGRQIRNYVSQKTKNAVKTAAKKTARNAGRALANGSKKIGAGTLTAAKSGIKTSVDVAGRIGSSL
ncbi:MAG TPA: hypothetical protein DEP65_06970, partial [Ruminococcus sp.]|nr:hypothetical protein [Ruminococcus sp.]